MKSRIRRFYSLPLDNHNSPPIRPFCPGVAASLAAPFRWQLRRRGRTVSLASPFGRERRRGQALLLAVLIMLLAALLSAGFLAVVSGNLNQSARIADKSRAIEASRAGIAYANAQLSGSAQGDLWRPIDVSPAPNPGSADPVEIAAYNFYYSQLEKVQGWAASSRPLRANFADEAAYYAALKFYRDATYGKFPDPNQVAGDAPKFLVKVEEIASDSLFDANHAGEIKITSIGLSQDDPHVFHRAIAYKSGRRKSPWASALRSVSNWRFGNSDQNTGVPYATEPRLVNATVFPANNVEFTVNATDKPAFASANVPFNVVIIKKGLASTVRGAVVTKVENDGAKLTFARLERTIDPNETIEQAAALGIGNEIDLLNTGNPAPYSAALPQPGGISANGSVWLQGQIQLSQLSKKGQRILTSGSLAIEGAKPLAQNSGDIGPTNARDASSNQLVSSSQDGFPGNLILTATAQSNGVQKSDLIDDGWNRTDAQTLGLGYGSGRAVAPFAPPKIDSPKNLARYRALARNSSEGIYIDNRADIERIGARAMTQAELVEMLTSPPTAATPPVTSRLGTAALPAATNVSLEERHLRGWVGPDEFLARGALLELIQDAGKNPQIRVTLDARSDANANGPDADKSFRDESGELRAGVYARVYTWPRNGTILAEGNLRIRGDVNLSSLLAGSEPANYPSLTVVSLGNIYIEGALSVDRTNNSGNEIPVTQRKKLMLLARKNVIVNPTRAVIGRTDAATIATNAAPISINGTPAAPKDLKIAVANTELFNKGDLAQVTAATLTEPIRGLVTGINANDGVLTINTANSGIVPVSTVAALVVVRSPLERREAGTAPASERLFYSVVDTGNTINRRILAPVIQDSARNQNRIVFDHVGALQGSGGEGLRVKAEDFDGAHPRPADFTATLTNKQPLDANGKLDLNPTQPNVQRDDRMARVYQKFSAPERKEFNNLTPPSASKALSRFAAELGAVAESRETPNPAGYRYTAVPTNSALTELPAHYLAGVGLRHQPGEIFTPPADSPDNQRRAEFGARTRLDGFVIPLATSVEYDLNGELDDLLTNSQSRSTRYIGFNPATGFRDNEDALTVDNSFYQGRSEIFRSSLDSRVLTILASANPKRTKFPQSLVLKRSTELSDAATSSLLPDYRVRALKLENIYLSNQSIKPAMDALVINAFVYAQGGSWLLIAGDYFRSTPAVRGIADGTGKIVGSYIDYDNSKTAQTNEYILRAPDDPDSAKIADLNRNGSYDRGEIEAALRFVRYNVAPIRFTGAITENRTAIVADVAAVTVGALPVVTGAVQDWTDKWATYNDNGISNNDVGKPNLFKFISYEFDPSLTQGSAGADGLRVPVTDDLLYQQ